MPFKCLAFLANVQFQSKLTSGGSSYSLCPEIRSQTNCGEGSCSPLLLRELLETVLLIHGDALLHQWLDVASKHAVERKVAR